LLAQTLPRREFEILVVDNAPDARALAEVRATFTESHVKWVHETTPGLSRARNLACRASEGQILAFIDDDAIARPDWLETVIDVFEKFGPIAAAVGGRVDPVWTLPRPEWLHDDLLGYLSIVNWGGQRRAVGKEEWIAGTNMAFRTQIVRHSGGFPKRAGAMRAGALPSEQRGARDLRKHSFDRRGFF
jgi:glucosyl-dolichyl phosphate glucuronosyltransferase